MWLGVVVFPAPGQATLRQFPSLKMFPGRRVPSVEGMDGRRHPRGGTPIQRPQLRAALSLISLEQNIK